MILQILFHYKKQILFVLAYCVYNHEQYGKFAYRHIKYYTGTIDPYSYLPKEVRNEFKKQLEAYQDKVKGWSPEQIVDDLVHQKAYTAQQGTIIKKDYTDLKEFLLTKHPKQGFVFSTH